MAASWPPLLIEDEAALGRAMPIEEWLLLPEDEPGELVGGRLWEEEAPDPALGSFEILELNSVGHYVKVVGKTAGVVDPVPGCRVSWSMSTGSGRSLRVYAMTEPHRNFTPGDVCAVAMRRAPER
ncbi:MAG: hypothetical protein ABI895_09730 [Deltaproteobacteria bacterium]